MIDAYEGREVATVDVPGAYFHADIPKDKNHLKVRETIVDIMCQINPEHNKNVRYKNWQKVLYMLVLRVIHGCIELDLHWYTL